jgi:hypothetical protein
VGDGLRDRGILDDAAALTQAGYELSAKVEDLTDDVAFAPWRTLSDDQIEELTKLAKVIREAVKASGLFPTGGFGPRYGSTVSRGLRRADGSR